MAFTKITAAGIGSTETVTLDGLSVINNGSFGGNLTVSGVLTYEDVTNVDSVGVITARAGVLVGSGITLSKDGDIFATGVTTSTSFTGTLNTAAQPNVTSLGTLTSLDVSGGLGIAESLFHTGDTDTRVAFTAADTISIETGGSSRFKIDSSGNITIGNDGDSGSNPSAGYDELCIEGGNEDIGMCFLSPAANDVKHRIAFGDSNNNKSGEIRYDHANDDFEFYTAGSERLSIASDGRITQITGDLVIDQSNNGYGGLRILDSTAGEYSINYIAGRNSGATAHVFSIGGRTQNTSPWANATQSECARISQRGISFNGDDAQANALDDYEEGSFTPKLGGSNNSGTYYVDGTGTYIKIGKTVSVSVRFNNVNLDDNASGNAMIFNMPFYAGHAPSSGVSGVTQNVQYYNVPFSTTYISNWYISSGANAWNGLVSRTNTTWDNFPVSDFHSATLYLNFFGTYFTA